jgi:nucleoside 2-deoxyribosyltransferase
MDKKVIYLIGSLKNEQIPHLANKLRELGFEVFDDWNSVSPNGDDLWKDYETKRGRTYEEALKGWHAHNVFNFDKKHIDRSNIGVLIMPAGKSAFLELGYMIGQGKPCFILMDDPERYDVMVLFTEVTGGSVCFSIEALQEKLKILLQ